MTIKKTEDTPLPPNLHAETERQSAIKAPKKLLSRSVTWFKGGDSLLSRLVRRVSALFVAVLLCASVIGLPIFIFGAIEWRNQNKKITQKETLPPAPKRLDAVKAEKEIKEIEKHLEKVKELFSKYHTGLKSQFKIGQIYHQFDSNKAKAIYLDVAKSTLESIGSKKEKFELAARALYFCSLIDESSVEEFLKKIDISGKNMLKEYVKQFGEKDSKLFNLCKQKVEEWKNEKKIDDTERMKFIRLFLSKDWDWAYFEKSATTPEEKGLILGSLAKDQRGVFADKKKKVNRYIKEIEKLKIDPEKTEIANDFIFHIIAGKLDENEIIKTINSIKNKTSNEKEEYLVKSLLESLSFVNIKKTFEISKELKFSFEVAGFCENVCKNIKTSEELDCAQAFMIEMKKKSDSNSDGDSDLTYFSDESWFKIVKNLANSQPSAISSSHLDYIIQIFQNSTKASPSYLVDSNIKNLNMICDILKQLGQIDKALNLIENSNIKGNKKELSETEINKIELIKADLYKFKDKNKSEEIYLKCEEEIEKMPFPDTELRKKVAEGLISINHDKAFEIANKINYNDTKYKLIAKIAKMTYKENQAFAQQCIDAIPENYPGAYYKAVAHIGCAQQLLPQN